jgi:glycosyltransferase involved in cell wall biosynthesis
MKVGFISQPWDNGGPPDPGGSIGLITWELARRLARSFGVVVCGPRAREGPSEETWENVQFSRFRLRPDRWLLRKPLQLFFSDMGRADRGNVFHKLYAARAARALRDSGCDIVHVFNLSQFLPIIKRVHPSAKIVLHMECDWLAQFNRDLIDRRLRCADAIIGCSDYISDRIRRQFPDHATRCVTVYNGVDTEEFSPRWDRVSNGDMKRAVFVGRMSPEKGVHVLLQAFETVIAREPDVKLEVVGGAWIPPLSFIVDPSTDPVVKELRRFYNGNYAEYLHKQAAGVLWNHISFAGHVLHAGVRAHLVNADVLVEPSVWDEPFGIPVVEAMACGVPVVATAVGGIPELVEHGRTGILVDRNDPEALANGMLRVFQNPDIPKMGTAGRVRACAMFAWESVTQRLIAVYEALVSGHSMPG